MAEGDEDVAKTPDALEAEAKEAEADAKAADEGVAAVNKAIAHAGDDQALGDAFNALVGANRGTDTFGEQETNELSQDLASAKVNQTAAHQRATAARDRATWARKAIAYALAAAGTTMFVAGIAGAGTSAPAQVPTAAAATAGPTAAATASSAPNQPPVVGPIKANLIPTNTFYNVDATDPEGDPLTFTWTKSNPCGPFTFQGSTAIWAHPHPPCPNEEFHPGTITVVVSDGHGNTVTRTYGGGSETGVGTVPAAPSPTATPTARAAQTVTPQVSEAPASGGGGGPNVPLAGGGLVVAAGGAGLLTQARKKKTCDQEKADEARTARELERAKEAFDDLDQTKHAMEYADGRARDADRAAAVAAKGVPTGAVSGEPMHFIGKGAPAAQAAKDAAQAAHDEAGWKHRDFDGKGGQAAWQRAKDALDAATKAHAAAAAALSACLEEIAPPPPPPPPTTSGTTGGTMTGPSVAVAPTTAKPPCIQGTKRNERVRTEKLELDDLSTAKVLLDSMYPGSEWIDVESFMDWAEFFKNGFFKGKNIKSFIDGPIEGVLDLVDFPDFLTYYDKMGDELLKGMRRIIRISGEKHKTGTYQLEFRRRYYTMTCTTWEECDGTAYLPKRSFTVTLDDAKQRKTSQLDVQLPSEVEGVLNRLFNELTFHNQREEAKAKRFEEGCK